MADYYKKKSLVAFRWNLLDQILSQAILLGGNLMLIKLLSPRDYGLFAIPFVVIAFLRSIQDLGFSNLIVHDENLTKNQFGSIQGVLLVLALVFSVLIYVSAPLLTYWTNEEESKNIMILLIPVVLMSSFYYIGEAKLRQQLEFKKIFIVNIIAVVVSYSSAIFAALQGFEFMSLVLRFIVYIFVLLVGIIWVSNRTYRPNFNFSSLKKGKDHALSIATEDFLQYLSTTVDSLFIGKFIGTNALGFYDRSLRMVSNPIQQISASFSKVLFPLLSRTKSDQSVTRSIYFKTSILIIAFIITLLIFLYFYAYPIVFHLFGFQWIEIVSLIKIFCLLAFANTLISLSKYLFASTGETNYILKFTLGFRPALIGLVILVTIIYKNIEYTALVYALFSFAASIFFFIKGIEVVGIKLSKYIANLGMSLSFSCVAILLLILLDATIYPCISFLDLMVHGLLFLGTIIFGHWLFKTPTYKLVFKILETYS